MAWEGLWLSQEVRGLFELHMEEGPDFCGTILFPLSHIGPM